MFRAVFNLNHPAHYFGIGPFSISVGNGLMIGLLILVFLLALIIPFPHGAAKSVRTDKADKAENK